MEGIVLEPEAFASIFTFLGAVALHAIVVGIAFLGYTAEEEKSGKRLYWAEWPIPEAEVAAHEKGARKAA